MNEMSASETEWIETQLIKKIAKAIGKESESVRCDISFPENCFFLSHVCFVNLYFGDNNETEDMNILKSVVKRPPLNRAFAAQMKMSELFHNEILFYTKFASGNPRFPRCVYVNEETLDDTVIVIENISYQGFQVCPEVYDIPLDYVFSAVEEIARLHATAYAMKETEPQKFQGVIKDIQNPRYEDNSFFRDFITTVATRPIDWLRRNCDRDFCDRMEKHLGNGFNDIMLASVKPVEPLATLCHGDFTRNNIFFRKVGGKLEAKLFDFALISYSSPAIDISTFLYLNCSAKDRIGKFDEIYRSYHNSLVEHLRDAGIDDLEKYSYDKMLADYKRKAAFGYLISVFFLPVVCGHLRPDLGDMFNNPIANGLKTKASGGEAMTELFGKMILELRDLGCLDHFL